MLEKIVVEIWVQTKEWKYDTEENTIEDIKRTLMKGGWAASSIKHVDALKWLEQGVQYLIEEYYGWDDFRYDSNVTDTGLLWECFCEADELPDKIEEINDWIILQGASERKDMQSFCVGLQELVHIWLEEEETEEEE